eukprot:365593-Chlamydomonas_euryale.AAC.8
MPHFSVESTAVLARERPRRIGCEGAGPGPSTEAHLVQQGVQRALEVSTRLPAHMKRKKLNKAPTQAVRTDVPLWEALMVCSEPSAIAVIFQ